jgi:hypothetical protein
MQTDGNLVVYCNAAVEAKWATVTSSSDSITLNADNNGNFWIGQASVSPISYYQYTFGGWDWDSTSYKRPGYLLWTNPDTYTYPRALISSGASQFCINVAKFPVWYAPSTANKYWHLVLYKGLFNYYSGDSAASSTATDNFMKGTVMWSYSSVGSVSGTSAMTQALCMQTDGNLATYSSPLVTSGTDAYYKDYQGGEDQISKQRSTHEDLAYFSKCSP